MATVRIENTSPGHREVTWKGVTMIFPRASMGEEGMVNGAADVDAATFDDAAKNDGGFTKGLLDDGTLVKGEAKKAAKADDAKKTDK
jgi:hypothetical protein